MNLRLDVTSEKSNHIFEIRHSRKKQTLGKSMCVTLWQMSGVQ